MPIWVQRMSLAYREPIAFPIVVIASAVWVRAAAWVTLAAIAVSALRRSVSVCSTAACASCIWPGVLEALGAVEQAGRRVTLGEDLVLHVDRARAAGAAEQLEEVLPALLRLLHDRRDARVVVAQGAIRARLEAAPDPDHDQDQECETHPDADQASDQELLASPLGPPDPAPRALRFVGDDHVVLFLIEECQTAEEYEHGSRRM